jgi:hypothetical protein
MVHVFGSCFLLRSLFAAVSAAVAANALICDIIVGASEAAAANADQCDPDLCSIVFEAVCNETHLMLDLKNGNQTTWETLVARTWLHSNLTSLDIRIGRTNYDKMKVNAKGFRTFAEALPVNLESLTLWLRKTLIHDKHAKSLEYALSKRAPNLQSLVLDMEGTRVTDAGIERVALALPNTLKTLALDIGGQRRLTDDSITAVSLALGRMAELRTLDLHFQGTDVTNDGFETVLSALSGAQLESLVLNARNTFSTEKSIDAVFKVVSSNTTVKSKFAKLDRLVLDFGYNADVTDDGIEAIKKPLYYKTLGPLSILHLYVDRTGVTKYGLDGLKRRFTNKLLWPRVSVDKPTRVRGFRAYRLPDYYYWPLSHFCIGSGCAQGSSATSATPASLITTASSATQATTTLAPTLTVYP